jgi:hypothetical protein
VRREGEAQAARRAADPGNLAASDRRHDTSCVARVIVWAARCVFPRPPRLSLPDESLIAMLEVGGALAVRAVRIAGERECDRK